MPAPTLTRSRYEAHDTPAGVADVFAAFAAVCARAAQEHRARIDPRDQAEEVWSGIPAYVRHSWAWWAGARAAAASDMARRRPKPEFYRRRLLKVSWAYEDEDQHVLTERWDPQTAAGRREWGMHVVRAYWITVEADGFSHYGDAAGLAAVAEREERHALRS